MILTTPTGNTSEWASAYRKKVDMFERPFGIFFGGLPRAVGRLLELMPNNQWKVVLYVVVLIAIDIHTDFVAR
jgi:hypothetical protein